LIGIEHDFIPRLENQNNPSDTKSNSHFSLELSDGSEYNKSIRISSPGTNTWGNKCLSLHSVKNVVPGIPHLSASVM
jgi:hypothetical protein